MYDFDRYTEVSMNLQASNNKALLIYLCDYDFSKFGARLLFV